MARTAVKQAIDEVKGQSFAEYPDPSTTPPVEPSQDPTVAMPSDLQGQLKASRNKMRHATKAYICGGIVEGLQEISAGNFEDIMPQLTQAVEIFSMNVTTPKLQPSTDLLPSPLFALPEAHNG